jgi:ANTAR domain
VDRGETAAENLRLQEELEGLHRALGGRAAIEQAKGIVALVQRCSPEEAFQNLVRLSQHRNVRLRRIAELLVKAAAGEPPAPADAELVRQLCAELGMPDLARPARPA